jgi:thiol-disulfide isomerase/thioredoxin
MINRLLLASLAVSVSFSSVANECPLPDGFMEANEKVTWSRETSQPVTLINLWAVWCPPCLRELPMLDNLATSQSYVIETIHLGGNQQAIKERFDELDIKHLPNTIEPDFSLLHDWGFQGLPATMIVVNGKVEFGYPGYIRNQPEELDHWLTCLANKDKQ